MEREIGIVSTEGIIMSNKHNAEQSEVLKPLIIGDLEIRIPIIQGGMGIQVSKASLASAVANYGGAGTIASVALGFGTEENEVDFVKASREGLQRQMRRVKELTKGIIGVNALVALNNYEDLVRTAISEKAGKSSGSDGYWVLSVKFFVRYTSDHFIDNSDLTKK